MPALRDQCGALSTALSRVNVHARYQHLVLLTWPDRTSDGTVQWAMDEAPTDQFERAHVWWPGNAGRLSRTEQSALSTELLRQVVTRLAEFRTWPGHDRDVLLAVLADVPTPVGRVVRVDQTS